MDVEYSLYRWSSYTSIVRKAPSTCRSEAVADSQPWVCSGFHQIFHSQTLKYWYFFFQNIGIMFWLKVCDIVFLCSVIFKKWKQVKLIREGRSNQLLPRMLIFLRIVCTWGLQRLIVSCRLCFMGSFPNGYTKDWLRGYCNKYSLPTQSEESVYFFIGVLACEISAIGGSYWYYNDNKPYFEPWTTHVCAKWMN